MKIILFSKRENKLQRQIISMAESVASKGDIEKYDNVINLSSRLKMDTSDISLILLLIGENNTLNDLLTIRNQLIGHRLIIHLPNQNNNTLSKAYSLYPRFISYQDTDFKDLKAIISKLLLYLDVHSKIKKLHLQDHLWMKLPN